jgi:hypothetical protein
LRRTDIKKLSIALAAAALVATPAVSYDVTPASLIALMSERIAVGDTDAVQAYVSRMQRLGVTHILLPEGPIRLDQLAMILTDDGTAAQKLRARVRAAAGSGRIAFMAGTRVIGAVHVSETDSFPTGSTG